MDRRLASDEWQRFISSGVWALFTNKRVDQIIQSLRKNIESCLREGNFNKAQALQGQIDGIGLLVTVIGQYHQELEQEVTNGR